MLNPQSTLPAEAAEHLLLFLEQTSLPTPLPMLRARERWILLLETLLGHGSVRGGRSRDFPFSAQRDRATELTARLVDCSAPFVPGRNGRAVQISLHSALVALYCIGIARANHFADELDAERYYSTSINDLLARLFQPPASARAVELLGLGQHGSEVSSRMRKRLQKDFRLAKLAAALANMQVPEGHVPLPWLMDSLQLRPADVEALEKLKLGLLVLKVKGAQRFLDACLKSFIQRGASAWCSLIAARTRDHLSDLASVPLGLLVDNEAVTVFLCPPGTLLPDIERQVRRLLLSDDETTLSKAFIQQFCPRLSPYFDMALAEGQNTTQALPALGYELRSDCSLLDLALPGSNLDESFDSLSELPPQTLALSSPFTPAAAPRCKGHDHSMAFKQPGFETPIWYNPSGSQIYGFVATTFSLTEITFSRMSRRSIREHLLLRHGMNVETPDTIDAMLRLLPAGQSMRLSVLKYDGDAIGELFRSVALIRRPATSLALETLLRTCWINSVARVIREEGLGGNPIDLVYLGGDDLLITLPDCLLHSFVRTFDDELTRADGLEVSFTFAALAGIDAAQHKNLTYIHRVNTLLEQAKRFRKGAHSMQPDTGHTSLLKLSRSGGLIVDYREACGA